MSKEKHNWDGKRYIGLARQSDDKDGNSSTQGQFVHLRRECAAVGMTETDAIPLEGVTGSMPGKRKDLRDLLERKRTRNDFEVIAIHVVDRLTRGGTKHGFWFEHECDLLGIELFFVGENLPSGPYSTVVRSAMYEAAHESSVSTGRRSTDGQTTAIKNGMFRTAGQTPIGCHRLYCDGATGRPKFVIRDLMSGLQEQVDLGGNVIATYGTIGSNKSRNRFKKQRNEFSLLIPGDFEEQRTVRIIFFLRYTRGWRGQKIADFLNRNDRSAPHGGAWSQRQAEVVYENECYTGFDVMNRVWTGRFYGRDKDVGYVALNRSEAALATAAHFQPVLQPKGKWIENEQPHMSGFLPQQVRALAVAAQEQMWTKRLDPLRPGRTYNAHPASDYLLSNLLVAEQDNEALVGTLSGPKGGPKLPYYRHKKSKRKKQKGSIFNNLIRADVLHEALMKLVTDVLLDTPHLRTRLLEQVTSQRAQRPPEHGSTVELEAEREELSEKIGLIIRCLTGAARKDAESELERLGRRRNEIEAQINRRHREQESETLESPEVVVDRIVEALRATALDLHKLAPGAVRSLVHEMVSSAKVNMATKAVSFSLNIPTRLLNAKNGDQQLCPVASSRSSTGDWTQVPFDVFACEYQHLRGSKTKPPCYLCKRMAA